MMDVKIASTYSYEIDIEGNPLTFISYDCTEKIINTNCVFEVLNALYGIPHKNVKDLESIIDKLKVTNLEHTKSIIIFSKYQTETIVWIKLERQTYEGCNLVNKSNLIDMYIHYHPGDNLIITHGNKLNNNSDSEYYKINMCNQCENNQSNYGTFCENNLFGHGNKKMQFIKILNHLLHICALVTLIICSFFLLLKILKILSF